MRRGGGGAGERSENEICSESIRGCDDIVGSGDVGLEQDASARGRQIIGRHRRAVRLVEKARESVGTKILHGITGSAEKLHPRVEAMRRRGRHTERIRGGGGVVTARVAGGPVRQPAASGADPNISLRARGQRHDHILAAAGARRNGLIRII